MGALGRMSVVAGLHVGALYLIASSLGMVPSLVPEVLTDTTLIEEHTPPQDPLPAVTPERHDPTVYLPQPPLPPTESADSKERITGVADDNPPVIPDVAPPAHSAVMVGVRQDSRHPLTQPAYPQTDIRQGHEGTAEIEVYVLPSGRIGDARILRSAGSPTLDQSALEEAKRRWRLLPAMRDGEPYAEWHRLKVTFNLRNR